MRQGSSTLLVVASCIALGGCITGFKHPLGPAKEGFIEPRILAEWACTSVDEPEPSRLTIVDFDGKQYYIQVAAEGNGEPGHSRAHATRIEGAFFLNVREAGSDPGHGWTLLEYSFADAGHLRLRVVDTQPFEDVLDDVDGVRERLARLIEDPAVLQGLLSCARPEAAEDPSVESGPPSAETEAAAASG